MVKKKLTVGLWLVLATIIGLTGCGGGGGGGETPNTTNTTTYNVSKFTSLETGATLSTTLTGTDDAGGSYFGSRQTVVDGPVIFEGRNLIAKRSIMNLTLVGFGELLSTTSTAYYNQDRTLYKILFSNGAVAEPMNQFPLPVTVNVGEFEGQDLSYNNENFLVSDWLIEDAGNGDAKIVVTSTTNLVLSSVSTINLLQSGDILSTTEILYNFPAAGVTTTLTGVVN